MVEEWRSRSAVRPQLPTPRPPLRIPITARVSASPYITLRELRPAILPILTVTPAAITPAIITQPVSQTVNAGQTATFSVAATGTAPLTYQWTKNGATVAGATSSTYTTPVTVAADTLSKFAVTVHNAAGNATSSSATLTVASSAVTINAAPASFSFAFTLGGTTPAQQSVTINSARPPAALAFSLSADQTWIKLDITSGSTPGSAKISVAAGSLAAGTYNGHVVITAAGVTNSPLSVPVTLVISPATLASSLTMNPTSLSFPNVTISTSSVQGISMTNSGTATINVSNVSVSGPGFTGSGVSAGLILAPSQTAMLNVTFAPAAAGGVGGGVTLTSNATNSPSSIGLTGTGVAAITHSVSLPWSERTVSSSLFGLTVGYFEGLSPSMQFGTTRSWDASNLDWSDANPSAGSYNFTYIDTFIAFNQARGSDIIYTFGRTPLWASSQPTAPGAYGPGECAPPADMSAWDDYVTAIATHAAGRIKYWEIWNEPQDVNYYCGDMPTMVMMAQDASRIIKGIDPTALILSPGVTGGPGPAWLSTFLSAGATASVDVIAFHGYWSATAEDVVNVISSYQTIMVANGVATWPIWDTESSWAGFGNLGTPTSSQQVGFIAKYYLLHWSQGVSRFVWYAYDGGPTWGGLWTAAGGESPAAMAYAQAYRWMVGASLATPCSKDVTTGIWTCTLSRAGGYTAEAVWIPDPTDEVALAFPVPAQYTVYRNLAGNVYTISNHSVLIGDQPILLETVDLSN